MPVAPNTLYNILLSDGVPQDIFLSIEKAEALFTFFRTHPLFRWSDSNNDCEDRANAICMILDKWALPNYKGWVFGGNFLTKETGYLINNWKYHVATILPVKDKEGLNFYVIDPATLQKPSTILEWATNITDAPFSHYLIKWNRYYIFPEAEIERDNWHELNRQNYKWTIQGLAGINGVAKKGQAEIVFNKNRVRNTEQRFKELIKAKPSF